jgi:hypothetical protein
MAADRPTVSLADLDRLRQQDNKPQPLDPNEVTDYATAALVVLRGLPRGEKLKVLRRMIKMLG